MKNNRKNFMSFMDSNAIVKAMVEIADKEYGIREVGNEFESNARIAADWLTNPECQKCGLLLMGGVGNGKTTMAEIIGRIFEAKNRKMVYDGYQGIPYGRAWQIRGAKDIQHDVLLGNTDWADTGLYPTALDIIDDIGEENAVVRSFGNDITPIIDYIEKRYIDCRPFIFTTNLDSSQLKEKYKARAIDRLREMVVQIPFKNESYRS